MITLILMSYMVWRILEIVYRIEKQLNRDRQKGQMAEMAAEDEDCP